jgi:ribosome-binding protein aMBF1 (putative translation factor)
MVKKEKTSDAARIVRNRYLKDDSQRKASVEAERVNAQVARMIYDLRNDAGLSQKELAGLVGTTQSVISRLEDADYQGHSLSILNRIAEALNQKLTVAMTPKAPEAGGMRHNKVTRNTDDSPSLTGSNHAAE